MVCHAPGTVGAHILGDAVGNKRVGRSVTRLGLLAFWPSAPRFAGAPADGKDLLVAGILAVADVCRLSSASTRLACIAT